MMMRTLLLLLLLLLLMMMTMVSGCWETDAEHGEQQSRHNQPPDDSGDSRQRRRRCWLDYVWLLSWHEARKTEWSATTAKAIDHDHHHLYMSEYTRMHQPEAINSLRYVITFRRNTDCMRNRSLAGFHPSLARLPRLSHIHVSGDWRLVRQTAERNFDAASDKIDIR